MFKKIALLSAIVLVFLLPGFLHAQLPGLAPTPPEDTSLVFTSPRPLLSDTNIYRSRNSGFCGELFFSNHGFGAGVGYQISLAKDLTMFASFSVSGARNSDELEVLRNDGRFVVPNKVNRLFMFPLTIGARYRLFKEDIAENFRPHISAGLGSSFIMAGPYEGNEQNFFGSFSDAVWYLRPSGFIGFGANIGSLGTGNGFGLDIRYYAIPFGGNGLESVRGLPLHDFGGIFILLSVGVVN